MPGVYFADFFGIGTTELIIILIILVLLFGAKKLPELARSVGKSANELKAGMKGEEPSKPKSTGKDVDNKDA